MSQYMNDRTQELLCEIHAVLLDIHSELRDVRQEIESRVETQNDLMIARLEAIAEAHGYRFDDNQP